MSIKAFNIDFNWDYLFRAASPGLYAHADAREHVRWYKELGATTIQTFCVTYNGYAWYPSIVAPVTPGMQGSFLDDMVEAGHREGMQVLGYFCAGSNAYWERKNPEMVHTEFQRPNVKIPFTPLYTEYFCRCVEESLRVTEIDGFMLDYFLPPERGIWLDCEYDLYRQHMGETLSPQLAFDAPEAIEFDRRCMAWMWDNIQAVIAANRPVLLWTNHPLTKANDPLWTDHKVLREVDWVLNEHSNAQILEWLQQQIGPHTTIIQNMCGLVDNDAAAWQDIDRSAYGLYGYAQADPATTLPSVTGADTSAANQRNIAIIRQMYSR